MNTTVANEIDALEFRLSEAKARIRQLEQELERQVTTAHSRSEHAAQNAEALATGNAVLREALEFYADARNYGPEIERSLPANDLIRDHCEPPAVVCDEGEIARAALAQCAPEEVAGC